MRKKNSCRGGKSPLATLAETTAAVEEGAEAEAEAAEEEEVEEPKALEGVAPAAAPGPLVAVEEAAAGSLTLLPCPCSMW
jgi:hypothetical protein